jgi:hypothetical protein
LGGKPSQLIRRERPQKGFQDDFRFAQAGIEIVVEEIEKHPERAGLGRFRNLPDGPVKFLIELADDIRENLQFVNEPLPFAKNHMMQKRVPVGGCLGCVPPEERRI